jgi:hypothetical protein
VRFKPSSTFAILSNPLYLTIKNKDNSSLGDVKQILQAVKTIFGQFPTFIFTLACDQNDLAFSWR